jgi:twitching motility two-component system response regulator PilG
MQGTLNEIDIRSILQLIELGQRTGELLVEAYPSIPTLPMAEFWQSLGMMVSPSAKIGSLGQSWFVFFVNGQIAYAADQHNHSLSRLRDYLRRYRAESELKNLPTLTTANSNAHEYAGLWQLLEKNIITPAEGRSIVECMIHETLFDLLSLHQGAFIFEMGAALAPQLTTLEISPLVRASMKQVQQWKQFHPHIQHPNQYIVIIDHEELKNTLPPEAYQSLSRWAAGKSSLRQLSRYLNRELLMIANALYPYAERGWLQLVDPYPQLSPKSSDLRESQESLKPAHIVCIDDDLTIGKNVEYILEEHGYQSTLIHDPLEALSRVFILKPNLILCDIVMPKLDGYELCAMLRQSSAFRQIPIIMLTGKETFIDRVRARMVGATDYLTKPFGASELLLLLEKYVSYPVDLR